MEKDRGAVLLIRAQAAGVIDCRGARLLGGSWWKRTNILLRALTYDIDRETARAYLDFCVANTSNSRLESTALVKAMDTALEAILRYEGILRPWAATNLQSLQESRNKALHDAYKRRIGDINDPAFQKVIAMELQRLKQEQEALKKEPLSPEVMIMRRFAERDQRTVRRRINTKLFP